MNIIFVLKNPQLRYNCGMANNGNLKPFQKGHDPRRNLKGRLPPSETNQFRDLLIKYGNKEYQVGNKKIKAMHLIAERIVDDAVKGKMSALKLLIDRTEGKARTQEQMGITDRPERGRGIPDAEMERLKSLFPDK